METMLNPDLAYLLLVFGSLLAILAVFTPGTGILEIGAFFMMLLAGWGIYSNQTPVNSWAFILLFISALAFLGSLRRSSRPVFLGLAILTFVIGSAYLFQSNIWWQPAVNPVLAGVVSVVTGSYLWVAVNKVLEAEHVQPTHDMSGLIGAVGEAKTNIHEEGSVQVAGELWTARSEKPISVESRVRVVDRMGFVLLVEPAENHPHPPGEGA